MTTDSTLEQQTLATGAATLIAYFDNRGVPLNLAQKNFAEKAFAYAVLASVYHAYAPTPHPDQLLLL